MHDEWEKNKFVGEGLEALKSSPKKYYLLLLFVTANNNIKRFL